MESKIRVMTWIMLSAFFILFATVSPTAPFPRSQCFSLAETRRGPFSVPNRPFCKETFRRMKNPHVTIKKSGCLSEASSRISSNVRIFQGSWKIRPRLFGYFLGNAKSTFILFMSTKPSHNIPPLQKRTLPQNVEIKSIRLC
ncbi:hypothetical protein SDC9_14648 [bioreactor metagenome]|uniref:Uncharacterized protein n=1 Tax=bioreactor metagenome TaxID=1076179 RepID=A0A644TPK3_9ZZZZ